MQFSIKNKNKINKKSVPILRIFLMFLSLSLIFVSGYFSTDVRIEDTSFYSAQVVKQKTRSKSTLSLVVRSNDKSGALPSWDSEFHGLYGSFKERVITFASTINASKQMNLKIGDGISDISDNLSMLYFGPTGTRPYPISNPTHFKHYILPIEYMFKDDKASYGVNRYIINISQQHANKMLKNKGLTPQDDGNYLKEEYEELIRTECYLIKDNNSENKTKVCINNIYLQQNYYYEGLHETIEDFIMVSYYLPWDLRGEQENCYFLTDSAYQNSYFMKHINNVYGIGKYDIMLNKNNIIGDVDENRILNFNTTIISSMNWVSILLLIVSIAVLLALCIGLFLTNNFYPKHIVAEFVAVLLPYTLFFVLFKITNYLFLFSSFSCITYLFASIAYIFIFFTSMFLNRQKRLKKIEHGDCQYEIRI